MNNISISNEATSNRKHCLLQNTKNYNITKSILLDNLHSISNKRIYTNINSQNFYHSKTPSNVNYPKPNKGKIDYLYHCRDLYKRYPESIETAQIGKIIQIDWCDTQYCITSKHIRLPGGHDIYVGQFGGQTVISDGDIYHIEDAVSSPGPSLIASMINLLSHLASVASHHVFSPFAATPATDTPGATHRKPGSTKDLLGLPFLLPGAAGAEEINVDRPRYAPSLIDPVYPEPAGRSPRDVIFCETNLHLPNHGARVLYAEFREEYIDITKEKIYSLEWLAGMNSFINDKLTKIFNEALFLKDRIKCADTIMIKRYIEKNLQSCFDLKENLPINEKRMKKIFHDQKKVEDYFESFNDDIRRALHDIDFNKVRNVIKYKNGVSYFHAKENYMRVFIESGTAMDENSAEFYHILELMEKAQNNYEKNLNADESKLIDKMLYFNDRELFLTMLDEQSHGLVDILIKRFFYYIFEYSRNNGYSTQGNIYIMPGEFTEFWHTFRPPEELRNEAEIASQLAEEIIDYMNNINKPHLHIDRVIKRVEFVRARYSYEMKTLVWSEASIWPYNKSLGILDKTIALYLNEINEPKESVYGQWSDSIISQIIYNKECTFMMIFLIKLQNTLISIMQHHDQEKLRLTAATNEQRLLEAKLLAIKMVLPLHQSHLPRESLLEKYIEQMAQGNIDLMLRAAYYWYSAHHERSPYRLKDLDALSIIKSFNEAESLAAFDFQSRLNDDFNSIFSLRVSSNFSNPKDYYDQFIYYNTYLLPQEARHISYKMIERSSIDYLELIYPPEKIYTFKILSRNYVQNSLTPVSDVSMPRNNFGTISLIKTIRKKWLIISSLLSAPTIRDIELPEDDSLFRYIIEESNGTNYHLNWQNRKQIPITSNDLLRLFNISYDTTLISLSPLNFFLVKPEENISSMPMPEYTLVAGIGKKPFSSLLEAIDYWNAETLSETQEELKEALRIVEWWQYLLAMIPFYDTLWKYWYDEDHKIQVIDVIFDVFDVACLFGQLTLRTGRKITAMAKGIADIASLASLHSSFLNKRVSQILFEKLPTLARKGSINLAHGFFNIFNPFPIAGSFNKSFQKSLIPTISADISWMSNVIINSLAKRATTLIAWKYPLQGEKVILEIDGTFTIDKGLETQRKLIKFANDFYQIIWDDKISNWRLVNQEELVSLNYAIPINKDKNGNWSALNFLDIDQIPLLNNSRAVRKSDPEFDKIIFEPKRILNHSRNSTRNEDWTHCYNLERILDDYSVYLGDLYERNSDLSVMLSEFTGIIKGEKSFRELSTQHAKFTVDHAKLDYIINLNLNHDVQTGYRILRMWKSENDHYPEDHMVIILSIDEQNFIIDILSLRPSHIIPSTSRQVFTEPDWITFIKTHTSHHYSLIKYKDFNQLNTAIAFPYSEADHAGKYIKNAFLIREPSWYKTALIKYIQSRLDNKSTFGYHYPPTILTAARHLIAHHRPAYANHNRDIINMTLPFEILQEAQIINATQAEVMINLLPESINTGPATLNFMSNTLSIVNTEMLLKLHPGVLLAVLSENEYLFHLMICVGNGRFAGTGNDYLCPSFQPGPSLIVAEEMGRFINNKLVTEHSNKTYTLIAGNPMTLAENKTVMLETMDIERTARIDLSGEKVIENIPYPQRLKMLTHNTLSLEKSSNDDHVLIIKLSAVSANIHPLYNKEMAHNIRALINSNPDFPAFSTVAGIELITCFGGFDGEKLRARTLADELGLYIKTLPYMDTETVRERQPQWYGQFIPRHPAPGAALARDEIDIIQANHNHFLKVHAKNQRLANVIDMLRDIKKSLNNTRIKRRMAFLPSIFIDLARLVIRDINFYDFVATYPLSIECGNKLNTILREYTHMIIEADEYFIQCFLDIILTVENFKHLAKWLYPLATKNTASSLASTSMVPKANSTIAKTPGP